MSAGTPATLSKKRNARKALLPPSSSSSLIVLLLFLLSTSSARSRKIAERRAFCREVRRSGPTAISASISPSSFSSSASSASSCFLSYSSSSFFLSSARRRNLAAVSSTPSAATKRRHREERSPGSHVTARGCHYLRPGQLRRRRRPHPRRQGLRSPWGVARLAPCLLLPLAPLHHLQLRRSSAVVEGFCEVHRDAQAFMAQELPEPSLPPPFGGSSASNISHVARYGLACTVTHKRKAIELRHVGVWCVVCPLVRSTLTRVVR